MPSGSQLAQEAFQPDRVKEPLSAVPFPVFLRALPHGLVEVFVAQQSTSFLQVIPAQSRRADVGIAAMAAFWTPALDEIRDM